MPTTPKNIELYITVAKKLGLQTEMVDSGARSPLLISKGDKFTLINTKSPGFYPTVGRWNATFTSSKLLSQTILDRFGYTTIKTIFLQPRLFKTQTALLKQIKNEKLNFPVLVKPNYGCDGNNIDIADNATQLKNISKRHFNNNAGFLVQPIINQHEYRILVVNNTVQLVHSKENHHIIGDGISTIATLLNTIKQSEKDIVFINWQYKKLKLSPTSILAKGMIFECHLTRKPSCTYYKTKDFDPAMERWAIKLAKDISSPVVGIDVFVPDTLSDPTSYTIIELNSNPAIYYLPLRCNDIVTGPRIVEKVLCDYFEI